MSHRYVMVEMALERPHSRSCKVYERIAGRYDKKFFGCTNSGYLVIALCNPDHFGKVSLLLISRQCRKVTLTHALH